MHDQRRVGHEVGPEPHMILPRPLHVGGVRGRPGGRAPRQADMARQLPGGDRHADMGRRAEGGGAGLHVDVRRKPAIADRRAGAGELRQRDPRQAFGMLQDQRALDRDRGHGARKAEGGDDRHLAMAGKVDDALGHRLVDLARRVGVDDGGRPDLIAELLLRQPHGEADHGKAVLHLPAPARIDEKRLVGQGQLAPHHRVMAQMGGNVLRFGRRADLVDHVEALMQLQRLFIGFQRSGTAAPDAVGRVGAAGAGRKDQRAVLIAQRAVGVRGVEADGGRGRCQGPGHDLAPDADHFGRLIDMRATGRVDLPRLGQQDLEPEILQQFQGHLVNGADRVGGQHRLRREGVAKMAVVDDTGRGRRLAFGTAAAAGRVCLLCHGRNLPRRAPPVLPVCDIAWVRSGG